MAPLGIIRAWKDEEYRLSLSKQHALLSAYPTWLIELTDAELDAIAGGETTWPSIPHLPDPE